MCEHNQFRASVNVSRLEDNEASGVITGYTADVKISCLECGQPFEFVGLEAGLSPFGPMVNVDSTELRAPIKPATGQLVHASNSRLN